MGRSWEDAAKKAIEAQAERLNQVIAYNTITSKLSYGPMTTEEIAAALGYTLKRMPQQQYNRLLHTLDAMVLSGWLILTEEGLYAVNMITELRLSEEDKRVYREIARQLKRIADGVCNNGNCATQGGDHSAGAVADD